MSYTFFYATLHCTWKEQGEQASTCHFFVLHGAKNICLLEPANELSFWLPWIIPFLPDVLFFAVRGQFFPA
jgi:hypothetical protein